MAITPGGACGFELGVLTAGAQPLMSVTTGAARPNSGTYGLHAALTLNSGQTQFWSFPAASRLVCRFYVKVSAKPAGSYGYIGGFASGAPPAGYILMHTSGALAITSGNGGTPVLGTMGSIDTTTHHMVEIQLDGLASPYTIDWKFDGVLQPRWTAPSGTINANAFALGDLQALSLAYTADFDDVVWGTWTDKDNDWFGPGKSALIFPGADGTHSFTANDFSTGDAGTQQAPTFTGFWDMVNDPVPWTTVRSTTDNIAQRVARTTGYVEVAPAQSPEQRPANGCCANLAYSATGTAADTAGCIVRNSAGAFAVLKGDLPVASGGGNAGLAAYGSSTNLFVSAPVPAPSAGWTEAEIEAIRWRFGGSDDINPIPTAQALALELDYPIVGGVQAVGTHRMPLGG
jgi:hypothetical protein